MKKQCNRALLREKMKKEGIDYYLFVTADPHLSEYINDYYKEREHFSGFTGSNGNLLIDEQSAYLWTDGRYFVQADKETEGSEIKVMKIGQHGVPSLLDFLKAELTEGKVLGANGMLLSGEMGLELEAVCAEKKACFRYDCKIEDQLWPDRPSDSEEKIWILPPNLAGLTTSEKIKMVWDEMEKKNVTDYLISKLDDIMWLFNIRGKDISCNPVAYAYAYFRANTVSIFLKERSLTEEAKKYFHELSVEVRPYHEIAEFLASQNRSKECRILLDKNGTNYRLLKQMSLLGEVIYQNNMTELWKAVKNETEQKHLKEAYLKDSIVLTKFLYWLKKNYQKEAITETKAAKVLDEKRREIPGFLDLSFPTISAYGANAAMMHYEAKEESEALIEENGIYLVDSGGQYEGGTTDVTRSIVLGEISKEIKKEFTLVCMGMLRLQNAIFLEGCSGRNLDILARTPLWKCYKDYKCGTGHGIGYMLNVHEGPHNISWQYRKGKEETPLKPGMLVSDEPGVYVAGSHGIRIENILLCQRAEQNENGQFLKFEPLTLVPIDPDGIDESIMEREDRENLNAYHKLVYESLFPYLGEDEKIWLKNVTKPI